MSKIVGSVSYRGLTLAFSLLGLAIAAYLTITGLAGEATVCLEGGGCDAVTTSAWGEMFGAPVALFGAAAYLLIALAAAAEMYWHEQAFPDSALALVLLTAAGLTFSVYLTVISVTQLGTFCIWCVSSLLLMTALFGLTLTKAISSSDPRT